MYKEELALINEQWLICHKTKPKQAKSLSIYIEREGEKLALNKPQWLLCHKTKKKQTKRNPTYIYIYKYIYIEREREGGIWH